MSRELILKSIAMFNNKGGVSKTTTTFNVGWMLAEHGHTVLMVDADPQCNLTGMVLGMSRSSDLEDFYETEPGRNLKTALQPAFESRPEILTPVECVQIEGREGLYLLPGHLGLSEYEVQLGLAQELSGSIQALQNLPGAMRFLIGITAERIGADYVIIDMSPGLGAINQNLVTTSDFIIIPTTPDVFSVMALDSLARILPRWVKWAHRAASLEVFREASYPFPAPTLKLLGLIVQRYRLKNGLPTRAFRDYFSEIEEVCSGRLAPALADVGMLLPKETYSGHVEEGSEYRIASISDFNALIASSQQHQKPVYSLTQNDVRRGGEAWNITEGNIDAFRETFEALARNIEGIVR